MLALESVSKVYRGGLAALSDVSMDIHRGAYGLLGPNGAGKSTLMTILATLQLPSTGRFGLEGVDGLRSPEQIRRRLGYMPQDFGFDPRMSVIEVMRFMAALKGLEGAAPGDAIRGRLQDVDLWELRDRKVRTLSGGMKRRLGLAQALLGDPGLVLLDEPTSGLDAEQRDRIMELLAGVAQNAVLVVSTHVAEDVRSLCPRIGVLDRGELRYDGTVAALLATLAGRIWEAPEGSGEGAGDLEVLRTRLDGGIRYRRILAEVRPGPSYAATPPVLEDAYRHVLAESHRCAA